MNKHTKKITAFGSIASLVLDIVVLILFALIVTMLHGTFEKMFKEMEVQPTGISAFYLNLPQRMVFYPLLVLAGVLLIFKEKWITSNTVKLVINKLFFVMMILVMVGYIVAMLMPMYAAAGKL